MNYINRPLPSVMKHSFAQIPQADIPRSQFDLSRTLKTAFDSMKLIPVFRQLIVPGDTFNVKPTYFARLSTPIVPVMDNIRLYSFFFFVPFRLVWSNFKKFMGEQVNPGDSVSYTMPVFTAFNPTAETLHDYLGIPPLGGGATVSPVSLFHRGYQLIWNEWFRDENLQNSVTVDTGDGPDTASNYAIRNRGKRHDYFTSCLPWAQKFTAQSIPLTGTAPVIGISKRTQTFDNTNQAGYESTGQASNYPFAQNIGTAGNAQFDIKGTAASSAYPAIFADLSQASSVTINALRLSFQVQRMYERDARGGTRYTEIVRSHFGVISPDARLQRPEYLGGGSTPVVIQPVAATAFTSGSNALGRLAAVGTATSHGDGFVKSFTEHGMILGIVCAQADLTYQQGLHRDFSISSRLDMYWPALSHIGEQAVLNKEIYLQGSASPANDAAAFGYQERYAEYRYGVSMITGKMRSTYATPLDYWHLSEKFTALPTLGSTFISTAPPIDRVVAVNTEPQFFLDAYFEVKAARPLPTFGVPGLVDHF